MKWNMEIWGGSRASPNFQINNRNYTDLRLQTSDLSPSSLSQSQKRPHYPFS